MNEIQWTHWGRIAYREALDAQRARWALVRDDEAPEAVFTLEHDHVITLGRRASAEDLRIPREALAARGVEVVDVDRGGEATYHGPGQLVIYAIINCTQRRLGPSDLVRDLAGAISDTVRDLGVFAHYDIQRPGLWVDGAKLAAVGMRITGGVSLHGAALNVTTALDAFSWIVPCGLPDARTTSLVHHVLSAPPLETLGATVAQNFIERLETRVKRPTSAP